MKGRSGPARILLADDHYLVREGMRMLLSKERDLEVVGEAKNGREAVELARKLRPDLILMAVRMPEMDGLKATSAIKCEIPSVGVLILSKHGHPDYLLEAARAGAADYVLKDATKQQLVGAVRRTLSGESPLNQEFAMQLLQRLPTENERREAPDSPRAQREEPDHPLTAREVEVLWLMAKGKTNKEIAADLIHSTSTVKAHVASVINKLGVSDRTQAAMRAGELGLLSR